MADRVKAEYFNAKDKATGEIKEIQFIPPAPSDGDLGGISQEKLEQIDKLNKEMENVKSVTDTIDERILEAFFGSMRNGKVYQTEVYLTETNPTSEGVKTLANANMVCEPSTDTVEGRDDLEAIREELEK